MSLLDTIRGKLRHGLLVRSASRRLARLGLRVNPYLVYLEKTPDERPGGESARYSIARIRAEDVDTILQRLPDRAPSAGVWRRRLDAGNVGLLLTEGSSVVGYTWASLTSCRGIAVKPLFNLTDSQAYLFDMYVVGDYRGRGVSGLLRRAMYAELARDGRRELYSISMYFNRPARVFKEKLGARRLELRLSIDAFGRWQGDYRLRGYARDLPTRWRAASDHPDPASVT